MPSKNQGKDIYESGENYLKNILMLENKQEVVHAIDLAKELDVSKASVSKALSKLEEKGFIVVHGRSIVLSDEGRAIAESMYRRLRFFTQFLIAAGVDPELAEEEACNMEHTLSEESFEKVAAHYGV